LAEILLRTLLSSERSILKYIPHPAGDLLKSSRNIKHQKKENGKSPGHQPEKERTQGQSARREKGNETSPPKAFVALAYFSLYDGIG
jgi:hypothetical protein